AISAGHVYILAAGPNGPVIDFTASAGGVAAIPGDTISGDDIEFRVEIAGAQGMMLHFWKNGLPWPRHSPVEIDGDPFVYGFHLNPTRDGRVRLELKDGPYLAALTNPIFYEAEGLCAAMPAPPGRCNPLPYLLLLLAPLAFAAVMRVRVGAILLRKDRILSAV
ncbi:hypothetical protein ACFL4G_12875, partial [Thermodesulfobacteriota bacterium]